MAIQRDNIRSQLVIKITAVTVYPLKFIDFVQFKLACLSDLMNHMD